MAKVVPNPGAIIALNEAIHVMMERLSEAVAVDARRNAPVRTGDLRDSIEAEVVGNTGRVSATSDHAAYVELGTSEMAAQPYLRPALYQKRSV